MGPNQRTDQNKTPNKLGYKLKKETHLQLNFMGCKVVISTFKREFLEFLLLLSGLTIGLNSVEALVQFDPWLSAVS